MKLSPKLDGIVSYVRRLMSKFALLLPLLAPRARCTHDICLRRPALLPPCRAGATAQCSHERPGVELWTARAHWGHARSVGVSD